MEVSWEWLRTEREVDGHCFVEYRLGENPCSIQSSGGAEAGWNVVCLKRDSRSVYVEKVAWFRYLGDARFFVESGIIF